MCYALPGTRCTPHARDKLARARTALDEFRQQHPDAKFDESSTRRVDKRLTALMLHQAQYVSDWEVCPGGRASIARLGRELKAEALAAREAGEPDLEKEALVRDLGSRFADSRDRDQRAKAATNARRREIYAEKKKAAEDATDAQDAHARRAERFAEHLKPWRHPVTGETRHYLRDAERAMGLDVNYYKTGNVSSAALDGERISNGEARRWISTARSINPYTADGKVHLTRQPANSVGEEIAERLTNYLNNLIGE